MYTYLFTKNNQNNKKKRSNQMKNDGGGGGTVEVQIKPFIYIFYKKEEFSSNKSNRCPSTVKDHS